MLESCLLIVAVEQDSSKTSSILIVVIEVIVVTKMVAIVKSFFLPIGTSKHCHPSTNRGARNLQNKCVNVS